MAVGSTLLGGVLGFWAALIAYFFLDVSILKAFAIYATTGFVTSVAIILFALLAREEDEASESAVGVTN